MGAFLTKKKSGVRSKSVQMRENGTKRDKRDKPRLQKRAHRVRRAVYALGLYGIRGQTTPTPSVTPPPAHARPVSGTTPALRHMAHASDVGRRPTQIYAYPSRLTTLTTRATNLSAGRVCAQTRTQAADCPQDPSSVYLSHARAPTRGLWRLPTGQGEP